MSSEQRQALVRLKKAIQAVPTGNGPWNARKAMEQFTQITLCTLVNTHKQLQQVYGSSLVIERLDYEVFGFIPLPPEKRDAYPWQVEVMNAYLDAVAAHEPFDDLLTRVHQEFLASERGGGLGQHFTPPDLAALVGALAASHRTRHPLSMAGAMECLYEPACGAGSLVLALLRDRMKQGGVNQVVNLRVICNDIDPLCSAMTALQLFATQYSHGAPIGHVRVTVGHCLTHNLDEPLGFNSGWGPSVRKEKELLAAKALNAAIAEPA